VQDYLLVGTSYKRLSDDKKLTNNIDEVNQCYTIEMITQCHFTINAKETL
jgi:hypothetical protein